jgi:ADP-ribosylglycohydrolase
MKQTTCSKIRGMLVGGATGDALFLRNPKSFGSIMEAVNAGGDNETNAKLVGEMLGAYHGLDFFLTPENKWAVEGLLSYKNLLALADQFCDTFGIGV